MKKYITLFAIIYFLNECHGKCSEHYVILQRTDLNKYIPVEMDDIDIFTYSYNNTEELKEIQKNKGCIITKHVTGYECHDTEPICADNSDIQHDIDDIPPINLSENNQDKDLTKNMTENIEPYSNNGKNNTKKAPFSDISTENDNNEINESGMNETKTDETEMIPNKSDQIDQDHSKKVAIVVTSIAAASGVLFFVVKKLMVCLKQGVYHIPEPNTSV